MVIPLVRPDRIVGALVVRRLTPGAFSDETCDMLTTFASQSAIALTNARLYEQLELQRRELATTSQHKSDFLASMSHELRTPLNAVIGFSEVLLERMFGDLNDRQADYVQDILDAGRHLLALLNDVLDLSQGRGRPDGARASPPSRRSTPSRACWRSCASALPPARGGRALRPGGRARPTSRPTSCA